MPAENLPPQDQRTIPAPSSPLPAPLEGLEGERARIIRIIQRLGELRSPDTLAERADLAHELVRAASRYCDVMGRVVLPFLRAHGTGDLDALDTGDAVSTAMEEVHRRTSHIDPRNAHTGDAQGLEDAIGVVVEGVAAQLRHEDTALPGALERLDADDQLALTSQVASAVRHASEHPRAPRSRVARVLRNAEVKLDNLIEDVSTPNHPGAPVVNDPPDRGAA